MVSEVKVSVSAIAGVTFCRPKARRKTSPIMISFFCVAFRLA